MATKKKSEDALKKYGVGVLLAVIVLLIVVIGGGALLFGFGINQLANGNIALGVAETLAGVLLLSTITIGKD